MFLTNLVVFLNIFLLEINAITLNNNHYSLDLQSTSNGTTLLLSLKNFAKIRTNLGYISTDSLEKCVDKSSSCYIEENGATLNITSLNNGWLIKWESKDLNRVFNDCISLDNLNWFGGPEKIQADWPVEKLIINYTPYISSKQQNMAIAERYWLNSNGGYVYIDERTPLFVDQNNRVKNGLCLIAAAQNPYNGRSRVLLSYSLIALDDPKQAHIHAVNNFLGKPTGIPNERLIRKPIWTTWAKYKTHISDDIVLGFAKNIVDHGFSGGQLEIDDKWETCYGSTEFDSNTFANINKTVVTLKEMNFTVTLWTHPFVNTDCEIAKVGLANDYFVKNSDGSTTCSWWNGKGHYIDFTKKTARNWYVNRLKVIQEKHGVDNFKFDAGENDWAPSPSILTGDVELTPNLLTSEYVKTVAGFGDLIEIRSAAKTQNLPVLIRMIDKDSRWDNQNGLYTLITTLLQMNLNGYTMVLPDMIGGNGYNGPPTAELLARWTQANTFMPSMQFSYLPWDITSKEFDGVAIIKKFVALHEQYVNDILEALKDSVNKGIPVNPPVWWVDPTNPDALKCDDQYMLGEKILVAPVIKEGARSRNIVLPKGKWKDGNNGTVYDGPKTIIDYPAPIDVLPYFISSSAYISYGCIYLTISCLIGTLCGSRPDLEEILKKGKIIDRNWSI